MDCDEREVREHCARLVEKMLDEQWLKAEGGTVSKVALARVALTLAARAIRRGRHLTAKEKLDNLKAALKEPPA